MKIKSIHDKEYSLMISMLREIRETKNLKQIDLASAIGVDQTIISKIENKERRLDLIELKAICHALDKSLLEFVTEFLSNLKQN